MKCRQMFSMYAHISTLSKDIYVMNILTLFTNGYETIKDTTRSKSFPNPRLAKIHASHDPPGPSTPLQDNISLYNSSRLNTPSDGNI